MSHLTELGQCYHMSWKIDLKVQLLYASRTLAVAEKGYSQLDKEAVAIVLGVKRFHLYLNGRHFVICSDHQPLSHLFNEHKVFQD